MSFGTLLLAAWTGLVAYVAARARGIPAVRRLGTGPFIATVAVLWALFPAGRLLGDGGAGSAGRLIALAGMHALATLFIVAVPLLAVDAVTGFGAVLPRQAPRLRGWAVLAGLALAAVALVQGMRPPAVTTHEVRLIGLPARLDGTTVVALSDLHLGENIGVSWLNALAAQVEALRPDIVVLVGDVLEGHGSPPGDYVPGLSRLRARLGGYAVTGNHENHGGEGTASAAFAAAGFTVLRDAWSEVAPGLVIAGVDDRGLRKPSPNAVDPLARATAGRPPAALVLLSHRPQDVQRAAAAGVGLMLSGHTHGGQIWPFGYLVRRAYPLFAGRYEIGAMTLVVGRGAGTWGPRMRLWRRGEILEVVLRAAGAAEGVARARVAGARRGRIL